MEKKTRSEVWEHFLKPFKNTAGKLRTRCKYCNNELEAETSTRTSSLRHHVSICKNYSHPIGPNQFELCLQRSEGGNEEVTSWSFGQRKITYAFTYIVVVDKLPFNFVVSKGFVQYMKFVCPRFHMPSRQTITRECYRLFMEKKSKLKNYFVESRLLNHKYLDIIAED